MSIVTVAATQMACSWDRDANIARAEKLIREAAGRGAQVILLQEFVRDPVLLQGSFLAASGTGETSGGSSRGRTFSRRGTRAWRSATDQRLRARQ